MECLTNSKNKNIYKQRNKRSLTSLPLLPCYSGKLCFTLLNMLNARISV